MPAEYAVRRSQSGGSFIGCIGGQIGNAANPITATGCQAELSGTLRASSENVTYAGGIFGQCTGAVYNSSFVMKNNAAADLKAEGSQLCFGGIAGAAAAANVRASYSVIDGSIAAAGAQLVQSGGIGGTLSSQRRSATACYSLIGGTIEADASGSVQTGAVTGASGRYGTMTECWWWSGTPTVTQANGVNPSAPGATEFGERSEEAMEAALPALNEVLAEYGVKYRYDTAKGYLVLTETE